MNNDGILITLWVFICILEHILLGTGFALYFQNGIVVYRKKINSSINFTISENFIKDFSDTRLSRASIYFDPSKISEDEIFFTELPKTKSIFRVWPYYPPVMRGVIKHDVVKNEIVLCGYLNWYVIYTVCFFLILSVFNHNHYCPIKNR